MAGVTGEKGILDALKENKLSVEFKANTILGEFAEDIKVLSQSNSPVKTGALRASHEVQTTDNGYEVLVDVPYALSVHENLEHPKSKFLERAVDALRGTILQTIKSKISL